MRIPKRCWPGLLAIWLWSVAGQAAAEAALDRDGQPQPAPAAGEATPLQREAEARMPTDEFGRPLGYCQLPSDYEASGVATPRETAAPRPLPAVAASALPR